MKYVEISTNEYVCLEKIEGLRKVPGNPVEVLLKDGKIVSDKSFADIRDNMRKAEGLPIRPKYK